MSNKAQERMLQAYPQKATNPNNAYKQVGKKIAFKNGYDLAIKDAYEWLLTHAYTFETPEMVTMFLDMFKQEFS